MRNGRLEVSCRSGFEEEQVFTIEEDFQICTAQLQYRIKETMDIKERVDYEDRCWVEIESKEIMVWVFSDGVTEVSKTPHDSTNTVGCTEYYEGLSN